MPRSEEWSQKAWKWQKKILENLKWSDEQGMFYTLEELMAFYGGAEWPKMIMPEQGWRGDGESVSFSSGEALVGLGVRNFKRIAACPWEERFNTSIEEIKKEAKPRYIIPLTTMGELRQASRVKILRMQSEEKVYPKMEDLWKFHPRFAMPKKTFTVGDVVVKKKQTIELRSQENGCITCYLKVIDQTVAIPMSQRGDFTIVEDGTSYTLQQVYDNFNLPQRVHFKSHPAGMHGTSDVLLISETRYDVLIACVSAALYVDDEEEEQGARDEDFTDISFIFLPRPINEKSPLADTRFFTWQYDPNDPTCQVIMSRASVFELDRFKDMNVAIRANSSSMSAVKEYSAENIYDYIKLHDFTEDSSASAPLVKSPAAPDVPLDSPSGPTAPKTSWLHSGATQAVTDPSNEEPANRPTKPDSSSKRSKYKLKTGKAIFASLKRNNSESDASSDKLEETHEDSHALPQVADSNTKTKAPRPTRRGSLPPLPNDGSVPEDDGYVQVSDTCGKPQAENKPFSMSGNRRGLPPPEEVKKGYQKVVQPSPLPKDMYDQKLGKKENDGPAPRPATDRSIQQSQPRPSPIKPVLAPKPGGGKAVVKGKPSVVQSQVAAFEGQAAVGLGRQGLQADTGGKTVTVVQGRVAETQDQVPTSGTSGGSLRIKFPPPNGNLTPLSELSSEQLAMVFEYLNLDKIAEQLKSNKVDGDFFENCLEKEDFAGSPFFATEFQLKQIERIRNGKY